MAARHPNLLTRFVSTLFGGSESTSATPANTPHAKPVSSEAFHATLERFAEDGAHDHLKAGRVNVIGLAPVKMRMGADWPRIAERAERIARNTIARHLFPGDMFAALPDERYIILFAHLSEHQARTKSRLIAKEIGDTLLGDESGDALEVKAAARHPDKKSLIYSEIPSLATLALAAPESDVIPPIPASVAAPRRVAPKQRHEELVAIDCGLPISREPMSCEPSPTSREDEPHWSPLVPSANAEVAFRFSNRRRVARLLQKPRFVYRPVWDTQLHIISGYRCSSSSADIPGTDEEALAALDFAALIRIQDDLRELKRDGKRLLLSLPIHFETLSRTNRRFDYIAALRDGLPEGTTPLLIAELVRVPDGVPKTRLIELTAPLQPHCRAVVARLPLETTDFAAYAGAHIPHVGCLIGRHAGPELTTMKLLSRFSDGARKAGLIAFVGGASSLSLVAAAVGAGFRFIDGECIAKSMEKPGPVVSFELSDVYRRL